MNSLQKKHSHPKLWLTFSSAAAITGGYYWLNNDPSFLTMISAVGIPFHVAGLFSFSDHKRDSEQKENSEASGRLRERLGLEVIHLSAINISCQIAAIGIHEVLN